MEQVVKVTNLKKTVGDFQIGPIDLQFEPGTITALVGKNGAGKSTLAKMMMNLVKPDEGEISLQGQLVSSYSDEWKKSIAYQPQILLGCEPFTGKDLKELHSALYPTWDRELFSHLVKVFGFPLNKPYGKLSPGVAQQLSMALALAKDTDILLLDEPTAHMDIPSKQILVEELTAWMERGEKTLIIISHQAEDIRKLADYIAVFHKGQIIKKATKDELIESYRRYWMEGPLPSESVPAEILRKNNRVIISNHPSQTEEYFIKNNLHWLESEPLEIDEIISLLMKEQ